MDKITLLPVHTCHYKFLSSDRMMGVEFRMERQALGCLYSVIVNNEYKKQWFEIKDGRMNHIEDIRVLVQTVLNEE